MAGKNEDVLTTRDTKERQGFQINGKVSPQRGKAATENQNLTTELHMPRRRGTTKHENRLAKINGHNRA
jgi:hypothetical protein